MPRIAARRGGASQPCTRATQRFRKAFKRTSPFEFLYAAAVTNVLCTAMALLASCERFVIVVRPSRILLCSPSAPMLRNVILGAFFFTAAVTASTINQACSLEILS